MSVNCAHKINQCKDIALNADKIKCFLNVS
jgi:hypothetical protein